MRLFGLSKTGIIAAPAFALSLAVGAAGGGKMYWPSGVTNTIHRANLDGTGEEDLGTTAVLSADTLALDPQPDCPAHLNGDGNVGITDLLELLAAWGTDPGGPPDFDGDGNVGITDLLELLANWGPCP